nr:MAG TPA: hypothetical protein [Bacteriophage sp.]DAG30084.1 MAG TPA: hypothetical protein [Caudoviricetes sp.]
MKRQPNRNSNNICSKKESHLSGWLLSTKSGERINHYGIKG